MHNNWIIDIYPNFEKIKNTDTSFKTHGFVKWSSVSLNDVAPRLGPSSLQISCNNKLPIKALEVQGHMTSIGLKQCMPPYAILNKKLCVTEIVAVEGATFEATCLFQKFKKNMKKNDIKQM